MPQPTQASRDADAPGALRRNFVLGVINGALFQVEEVLTDPSLVVSWFLAQLGVANFWIGLVPPIRLGVGTLPQLFVSRHVQHRPYKMTSYRLAALYRWSMLLAMTLAIALIPPESPWLFPAFFVPLVGFALGAGFVGIPFLDMVAKVIPATRRGLFFSQRSFWGSILALGASSLVGWMLTEPYGLVFPQNIAVLFGLATLAFLGVLSAWSLVREPPGQVHRERVSWQEQLCRGWQLWQQDPAYARYLLFRLALQPAGAATAFYILYARAALGIPAEWVGAYLTARTASTILSNLVWGRLSDRRGNRVLLRAGAGLGLTMPLLALLVGAWAGWAPSAVPGLRYAYGLVFVAGGAMSAASGVAFSGYLLDISPEARRPLYLGFGNTLVGLGAFVAFVGGPLVDWAGYPAVMGLAAVSFGAALVASFFLVEPREAGGRA